MKTYVSKVISGGVLALSAVFAFGSVLALTQLPKEVAQENDMREVAQGYVEMARANLFKDYQPKKAIELYGKALKIDPDSAVAAYERVRAYGVVGEYDAAFAHARQYRAKYPADTKMLYTEGLIYGFAGNFKKSQELLSAYVATPASKWQSRLDLAWAYYQDGEYAKAKVLLDAWKQRCSYYRAYACS
jgi:Tfp pilus assembly protein PilF